MILQALTEYYDRKAADPDSGIAPQGWEWKGIPFLIVIDEDGRLVRIEDTRVVVGKKLCAKDFLVPQAIKRTAGIAANLLWDNVEYLFGIPVKMPAKEGRAEEAHKAFLARLKPYCEVPDVRSIMKFLCGEQLAERLRSDVLWPEVLSSGAFLSFKVLGREMPVTGNAAFKVVYDRLQQCPSGGKGEMCLITGQKDEVALTHPSIKGVLNANTTGGNIVSFNFDAACSHGQKQGKNAPIGKRAAFAYTTALNTLLSKDSRQKLTIGDATVVFWSARANRLEDEFALVFVDAPKDDPDRLTNAVSALLNSVKSGAYEVMEGETRFFVLGLSPNAARLSVRFWHAGTVAEISNRFAEWFEDLHIVHGPKDKDHLSMFCLLKAMAVLGKAENIPPNLAGDVMRAILEGLPLPETLLQATLRRIKVERGYVSYPRAKIIKACLNRKMKFVNSPQERMLTVALNKENPNIGYRLGRLFAVLERIQETANPDLNATIRDRYYASASATPAAVFGTLMRMKNHHLSKLVKVGFFESLLGEILDEVPKFPLHLKMDDQGQFAIGYYHQRQSFFAKKDVF